MENPKLLLFCEAAGCLCISLTETTDIWFCLADVDDKRRKSTRQLLDRRSDSDTDDVSSHKLSSQLLSVQQDWTVIDSPVLVLFVFPSPIVDDGSCIFNVSLCCLVPLLLMRYIECLTDRRENLCSLT